MSTQEGTLKELYLFELNQDINSQSYVNLCEASASGIEEAQSDVLECKIDCCRPLEQSIDVVQNTIQALHDYIDKNECRAGVSQSMRDSFGVLSLMSTADSLTKVVNPDLDTPSGTVLFVFHGDQPANIPDVPGVSSSYVETVIIALLEEIRADEYYEIPQGAVFFEAFGFTVDEATGALKSVGGFFASAGGKH